MLTDAGQAGVEIELIDGQILTPQQSDLVVEQLPLVRREVTRWRLKLKPPGRLLIIDHELIAEIKQLLAGSVGPHAEG